LTVLFYPVAPAKTPEAKIEREQLNVVAIAVAVSIAGAVVITLVVVSLVPAARSKIFPFMHRRTEVTMLEPRSTQPEEELSQQEKKDRSWVEGRKNTATIANTEAR